MTQHNSKRRSFVKTSAAAAAGFMIVPRFVLGKGYTAPSDMLNLGFIGTGKQARGLLNNFKAKTNIVAGADVDLNKLHYFHSLLEKYYSQARKDGSNANFKGFTGYDDYREILQRKDIDAVVIATPDHWHAVQAIQASNAGKHVYCEKPLAHTVEEGRAMVNAARKNKIVFQTGSMQRSWRNFRHACELVRNGYLGKISEVLVTVGPPPVACDLPAQPLRAGVNWDAWVGPAPYREFHAELAPPVELDIFPNWRNYKEYGGGMVCDWGAHMFDIAQWALGMDESGPVKLIPPGANAKIGLQLIYENGIVMKHEDFGRGSAVRFIGEKGRLDVSRSILDSDPANIISATIQSGEVRLYESNDHYADWLNCIKNGNRPICDVETGHRTSSVCNIANIAYQLGRTLEWDPAKEKFKKDAAADALLKPMFREGWDLNSLK
ncbi:MAG: Gfo/Idh/MocA family protein [Chitinophagia bacterium]